MAWRHNALTLRTFCQSKGLSDPNLASLIQTHYLPAILKPFAIFRCSRIIDQWEKNSRSRLILRTAAFVLNARLCLFVSPGHSSQLTGIGACRRDRVLHSKRLRTRPSPCQRSGRLLPRLRFSPSLFLLVLITGFLFPAPFALVVALLAQNVIHLLSRDKKSANSVTRWSRLMTLSACQSPIHQQQSCCRCCCCCLWRERSLFIWGF